MTSKGWRRPGLRRTRYRRPRRALIAAALLLSSGCGYAEVLEDYPVSEAVFMGTGLLAGLPVAVAAAPVTVPLAQGGGCKGLAIVAGPGLAIGGLAGGLVSLPVLICESVLGGVVAVCTGRRHTGPEPPYPAPPPVEAEPDACGEVPCEAPPPAAAAQLAAALARSLREAWPPVELGPPPSDALPPPSPDGCGR